MRKIRLCLITSGVLFLLFLVIILLLLKVDVRPIGPNQSLVGLASLNQFFFEAIGIHLVWYRITEWIGLVALLVASAFVLTGLFQLYHRKSLRKVDGSILLLGLFYLLNLATYLFFEAKIINYRPVLLSKTLEASFPSSHTLIVLFILSTALIQFDKRLKRTRIRVVAQGLSLAIMAATLVGRLLSGVHWFTDILAGLLLAIAYFFLYWSFFRLLEQKAKEPFSHEKKQR